MRNVQSLNGLSPLDQHEFNIVGNSSLVIIYHPERYDLSAFNITTGEGWIMDTKFQDIDLETNELLFEWSPIEHVALSESYVLPNTTEVVGTGLSQTSPWDFVGSFSCLTDMRLLIALVSYELSGQRQ